VVARYKDAGDDQYLLGTAVARVDRGFARLAGVACLTVLVLGWAALRPMSESAAASTAALRPESSKRVTPSQRKEARKKQYE